jgi:hypothetical protein
MEPALKRSFFPFVALPEELRQRVYYWHIVRVTDGTEYDPSKGHRDALLTVCKTVSEGYLCTLFRETTVCLEYDFRDYFADCTAAHRQPHASFELDVTCRRLFNNVLSLCLVVAFRVCKKHLDAGDMTYVARFLARFEHLRDVEVNVECGCCGTASGESLAGNPAEDLAEDLAGDIRRIDTVRRFGVVVSTNEFFSGSGYHYVAERRTLVDGETRWMPYPLDAGLSDSNCWMYFLP